MLYRVLTPIQLDGNIIAEGTIHEFSDEQSPQLLEVRAIEPVHAPFAKQQERATHANITAEGEVTWKNS
jgi:hypothetical protein